MIVERVLRRIKPAKEESQDGARPRKRRRRGKRREPTAQPGQEACCFDPLRGEIAEPFSQVFRVFYHFFIPYFSLNLSTYQPPLNWSRPSLVRRRIFRLHLRSPFFFHLLKVTVLLELLNC